MLRIRLLGRPMLQRNGVPVRLEGRKTWALLAFLALASGPTSRRELVDRLWSDADDPLGALRWALSQVRKAISPDLDIDDGERGLILRGEVSVDALELVEGRWDETTVGDLVSGELMEGFDFDEAPEFARWLDVQRARFGSASTEALRSCAALIARADPDLALRLAERALNADPFDDAMHELVVDVHVARGDLARARAYADATAARYRADLGVASPAGLARALERSRGPAERQLSPDAQARALLELADARAAGTGFSDATDLALRAAQAAAASEDNALEARALVSAVNYMTLCARGTPREWLALLHRALGLANATGDRRILSDVEAERGRIAGMQGAYGASETALRRAVGIAQELGDAGRVAYARRFLGVIETDRCDFVAAEADLLAGTEGARSPELAMAWLARLLVKAARFDEAVDVADRAIAGMRKRNMLLQLPLAILSTADVAFARGDRAQAMDLYGRAFGLADAQPDHDWCALALRGLARIDRLEGRPERARATMHDALARVSGPHGYRWVEAAILVDLLEWGDEKDQAHMQRALRLTKSAPMPDLAARLETLARSHTPAHTVPS